MTRKRFIKLAMSEGCSKRVAVFAAKVAREYYGSYLKAYGEWGVIQGRFEMYVK